jgi:uncharacterized protein (DUF427 family)
MKRAVFDGAVVAESDDVRMVEGMPYFPVDAVDRERLVDSPTSSVCFWKGRARYWHVQGNDDLALNGAFAYPRPWPLARWLVRDRIAFWGDVAVEDAPTVERHRAPDEEITKGSDDLGR